MIQYVLVWGEIMEELYKGDYEDLKIIKLYSRFLKMSIRGIKNYINLDNDNWHHAFTTNCYSFALGLDIKEYKIAYCAYQPGIIYSLYSKNDIMDLVNLTYEQRMLLDFKALGIELDKQGDLNWKIALFENKRDFHFLRQMNDGIWMHKKGYVDFPSEYDDNKKIITDIDDCYFLGANGVYKKVGVYNLSLKR